MVDLVSISTKFLYIYISIIRNLYFVRYVQTRRKRVIIVTVRECLVARKFEGKYGERKEREKV